MKEQTSNQYRQRRTYEPIEEESYNQQNVQIGNEATQTNYKKSFFSKIGEWFLSLLNTIKSKLETSVEGGDNQDGQKSEDGNQDNEGFLKKWFDKIKSFFSQLFTKQDNATQEEGNLEVNPKFPRYVGTVVAC